MRDQATFLHTMALVVFSLLALSIDMNHARSDDRALLSEGRKLSEAEVEKLEAKIATDDDEYDSRVKLLGYYFRKQFRSDEAAKAHQELAIWMIENHSASEILGNPETRVNEYVNKEGYARAKALWLKNVETHSDNPQVYASAAAFFLFSDRSKAEVYLKKAQSLEPKNPKWTSQLAQFYKLGLSQLNGQERKQTAAKALTEFEKSFALLPGLQRQYLLTNMAKTAFEAEQYEKAEKFSKQLLVSTKVNNDWNTGNAIHHGNQVLGRIALKNDDLESAKSYLLASGKTPGSPQLNSFGPNMTLAQELLEQGKKEAVLKYFDLCGNFWNNDKLKTWKQQVTDGETPEFGANLNY